MGKEPYQDFLCRIAKQVDSLLIEDTSAMGRFRQHLQSFAVQENKHIEWMEMEKEKCVEKGMAFTVSSNMEVPPEYRSPGSMLVPNSAKHFPEPNSKEEEYQRYYIILASIHDNILPEVERIDNGILPEEAAYLIWNSLHEFYDSEQRRLFTEQALERVKTEVTSEVEQEIETQEKDGQSNGGNVGGNMQATSKTTKRKVEAIRDQVFICYSHKDKRWLEDLQIHLKPYVRNGSVTAWSDKQIAPGSKWLPEIKVALAHTKVAALLVTPYFLASDFIHENELTPLLKEAEKGDVRIIWIPVRACAYKETPLKDYQGAIDADKPLANMKADRDKAWVKICEEIKKAVNR